MKTTTESSISKEIEAEIERRNELFKDKTKSQKRVLIAQDVIEQIQRGTFTPVSRAFLDSRVLSNMTYKGVRRSLREVILSKEANDCKCCALGGMFLSTVLFKNEEMTNSIPSIEDVVEGDSESRLDKIFSAEQLKLIEIAFEGGRGVYDDYDVHGDWYDKAVDFGNGYNDDAKRMIAIMENIITNKGRFIP